MQKDISTVHGGNAYISPGGFNFTSLYSSFTPNPSVSNSPSDSPTDNRTTTTTTSISPNNHHNKARGAAAQHFTFSSTPHRSLFNIQDHQDLVNRHNLCLNHLREATDEAEALRRENNTLRVANRDLNKQLSLVIQASTLQQKRLPPAPSDYLALPLINGLRGLCIDDKRSDYDQSGVWGDQQGSCIESPTSVMESNLVGPERVSLPKSISVRSNGYLTTSQVGTNNGGRTRTRSSTQPRTRSPVDETQKVYVPGGKEEGQALELEVYKQGMFKTELCNKWQETGTCPYGEHCQFAHGIEELRPVIRHPRYKTEVCRMVLAGDPCPYGHRCHFRHALTDQEKLIAALNPRALKLNR